MREPVSAPGLTGTAFHAYRKEYSDHLIRERKMMDPEWAQDYLKSHPMSEDARELVARDIPRFWIDPESSYPPEVFLSVGHLFEPLQIEFGMEQGYRDPAALVSGTIDLLTVEGDVARIYDAKTAHSATSVSEAEAAIYCTLVFAHFPSVNAIDFNWEFARLDSHKTSHYERSDLVEMHALISNMAGRRRIIQNKLEAGEKLSAAPDPEICPYCALLCPLLQTLAEWGIGLKVPVLQTLGDAQTMAMLMLVAEQFLSQARPALRDYIAVTDLQILPLRDGWFVRNQNSATQKIRLLDILHDLGLSVVNLTKFTPEQTQMLKDVLQDGFEPASSPLFDVPLNSIEVRGSSLKGFTARDSRKGVSRQGLREALTKYVREARNATPVFRRGDPAIESSEAPPLLPGGDES